MTKHPTAAGRWSHYATLRHNGTTVVVDRRTDEAGDVYTVTVNDHAVEWFPTWRVAMRRAVELITQSNTPAN